MQSFINEFKLLEGPVPVTPVEPQLVLMKKRQMRQWSDTKMQSVSGFGKLSHMMKWSWKPDVLNVLCNLTQHMNMATLCHLKVIK